MVQEQQRVVVLNPDSRYNSKHGEVTYVSAGGAWAILLMDGDYEPRRFKTKYLQPEHLDPSPVPTPVPVPVPPPPPGGVASPLTKVTFDGSGLAAWNKTAANSSDSINEVLDPLGGGFKALRFRVRAGDSNLNDSPRAQLETPHDKGEGDEFDYSFRLMLGAMFPKVTPTWFAVHEVYGKPYAGSPPWGIGGSAGQSILGWSGVWNSPLTDFIQRWRRISVHEVFSQDPAKGRIVVEVEGKKLADVPMATRNATNDEADNGIYAQFYHGKGAWPEPTEVFFHDFKVGMR